MRIMRWTTMIVVHMVKNENADNAKNDENDEKR